MKPTAQKSKWALANYIAVAFVFVAASVGAAAIPQEQASAAACQAPASDYGSASVTADVSSTGTYRAWSRMNAPSTTNNSYLLEIDGKECFVVGDGSAISPNGWRWVDYQQGNTSSKINISLSAGSHTFKLIGREPDVKLDRILLVADSTCVPEGFGANCETVSDTAAPVVELTAPVQGANVSGEVGLTAQAEDDASGSGMNKVEFYVNNQLKGSDTSAPYIASWDARNAGNGDYTITAKAYDKAGNVSSDSAEVKLQNGTIDDQPPSIPTSVTVRAEAYNRVKVSWGASTDNVGVAGYLIYRDSAQIASITRPTATSTSALATAYIDSDVDASTRYEYTVVAYDEIGNKSRASTAGVVTTPSPPTADATSPSAPNNLRAVVASGSQINLSWNASTDNIGVTSYDVYRATGASQASRVASLSQTSFGSTNLRPDTEYSFYVIAKDAAGNQSQPSATVSATTQSAAPAPGSGNGGSQNNGVIVGNVSNIGGVTVRIFTQGQQKIYRTDSQGNYRIDGLAAGKYPVIYTHPGYFLNAAWVNVSAGQTTTKDMKMFSKDIKALINSFWNR